MDFKQDNLTPEDIRNIILNTPEPLLIQNKLKCDLISWSLKDWEEMLKDELLKFRCGKYQYTVEPQWETTCLTKQATFREFLDNVELDSNEWWYFDYKYLCKWFTDKQVFKEMIDWSALGFAEITANESTIWIGSKGAHTSCHMDTYGCNIILQMYGRKQWIIFPPDENLKPTRIPFEESSIYSKLNFFSPREKDFRGLGIKRCHKVILNPGDVLVLPYRWWHYVENLDTAISINVWIPLSQDNLARIKESIATILIGQMAKTHADFQNTILNPNMIDEMVTCDQALDIISVTLHQSNPVNNHLKLVDQKIAKQQENYENMDEILNHNKFISKVPILSEEEFKLFLRSQSERFTATEHYQEDNRTLKIKKVIDFLEVITDDEVLSLIAKKLIEKR